MGPRAPDPLDTSLRATETPCTHAGLSPGKRGHRTQGQTPSIKQVKYNYIFQFLNHVFIGAGWVFVSKLSQPPRGTIGQAIHGDNPLQPVRFCKSALFPRP